MSSNNKPGFILFSFLIIRFYSVQILFFDHILHFNFLNEFYSLLSMDLVTRKRTVIVVLVTARSAGCDRKKEGKKK